MMKTQLQQLNDLAAHYRDMAQNCADAIRFLSGELPDGFNINFTIRDKIPVLSFAMQQEDESFCVGLFMSWHEYYTRKLGAIEMQLRASTLVSTL